MRARRAGGVLAQAGQAAIVTAIMSRTFSVVASGARSSATPVGRLKMSAHRPELPGARLPERNG